MMEDNWKGRTREPAKKHPCKSKRIPTKEQCKLTGRRTKEHESNN